MCPKDADSLVKNVEPDQTAPSGVLLDHYNTCFYKFQKTITEELKETGEIAASADNVVSFLKKQFDGKLSPVEWDEISLDIGI